MALALTAEQELAADEFIETVSRSGATDRKPPVSRGTAVKFLFARKFDVGRAAALFEQHENTRRREGLHGLDPYTEPLKAELDTGKFTILPGRDSGGAAIALFTAHLHCPTASSHQNTLRGVVYQLDAALDSPRTQRSGLIFIYDMSDSKYANFDYDLSQKILMLLKGGYPARLKKVLIVTAPLWFKAPFRILRLFVREKLRERVFTVSVPQLAVHVPRAALPRRLGGTGADVDHAAWLRRCRDREQRRLDEEAEIKGAAGGEVIENGGVRGVQEEVEDKEQRIAEAGLEVAVSSSASSGFSDDDSLAGPDPSDARSIGQIAAAVREQGRAGLVQEYAEIRARPPDGSFNHARVKVNVPKNRYTDVLCYDHSRVLLSQIDGEPGSDYINANFVDGYKQKNAFISTQGPLPKTACDFWRMVWEQQCLVIVMTTRVAERGRTKCFQYWEPRPGDTAEYGALRVTTDSVETNRGYTVSELTVGDAKTGERRSVSHWQFTSWPDYGVPECASAMLDFVRGVRDKQRELLAGLGDTWAGHPRGPPIVVHCSAGIGRTGTFCTLDICISRLEDVGTADVRGTVEKIRSQRAYSIQMPDQYVFCHLALIEYGQQAGLLSPTDLSGFEERTDDSD